MVYALGIAVVVLSLLLVVVVAMQSDKGNSLSGAIVGGAETFFGQSKANTKERVLSKITVVASVLLGLVVLAMYIFL